MRPLTTRQTPFRVRGPRCPVKTGASFETSSPWLFFHARKAFRWAFSSWGMKDLALLGPLALADHQ